jgi:hypothetical protein
MYASTIDSSLGGNSIRRKAPGRAITRVNDDGTVEHRSTVPFQYRTSNCRCAGGPNNAVSARRLCATASSLTG